MTEYDEILNQVPIDELAAQLGVDRSEVQQAVESALPALLGGLQANASDPAGASSLMAALSDHQAPVSTLGDIDENDGQAIVGNIFGGNTDRVVNQLGGLGSGGSGSGMGGLVQKLLPLLAPIVMSWLANKIGSGGLGSVLGGGSAGGQTQTDTGPLFPGGQGADSGPVQSPSAGGSSNPLQDILGQVLGGAAGGSGGSGGGAGDILGGLLGGLLGGGKR
ncbi:DUF937 domain-containing protein [Intrasporangium mesophilum]